MKDIVDGFFIPLRSVTAPVGSTIDTIALGLLQPAVQEWCFPWSVEGDGNCFFRSLSLVLFGAEACFEEMSSSHGKGTCSQYLPGWEQLAFSA